VALPGIVAAGIVVPSMKAGTSSLRQSRDRYEQKETEAERHSEQRQRENMREEIDREK